MELNKSMSWIGYWKIRRINVILILLTGKESGTVQN